MLDEGYASVTSRHVASEAGLKPQLVHYYFRTMDDLFLALFRRGTEQGFDRSPRPYSPSSPCGPFGTSPVNRVALRSRWSSSHWANAAKAIRAEILSSAERFRSDHLRAIHAAFERHQVDQMR